MPRTEQALGKYPRKFGSYYLLCPLASRGMGALYLAATGDRGHERLLVIKTVQPQLTDPGYATRFHEEASFILQLLHRNLIPVLDAGVVEDELFLAMDFVEGRNLREMWNQCAKRQVAFPIEVVVYIIKELCRGLSYVHSFSGLRLVHRNIAPQNIIISCTGEVRLTEFGIATVPRPSDHNAGLYYGRVAYMSPEQARWDELDGCSDLYVIGIIMWELLTGRQLFPPSKDETQDIRDRAQNPVPMRPSQRAPRVPAPLDAICLKALAGDKARRYADCNEMRLALQDWLAHNAPAIDEARIAKFFEELFGEDLMRERLERSELVTRFREFVRTQQHANDLAN